MTYVYVTGLWQETSQVVGNFLRMTSLRKKAPDLSANDKECILMSYSMEPIGKLTEARWSNVHSDDT